MNFYLNFSIFFSIPEPEEEQSGGADNEWMEHLKTIRKNNPDLTTKQTLKLAAQTFKRSPPKGVKRGRK